MDDRPSIWGTLQHGQVGEAAVARPQPLVPLPKFGTEGMTQVLNDYTIFTPGPLYTRAGLDIDVLAEFLQQLPEPCHAFFHTFPHRFFLGVGGDTSQEEWDRCLYFIQKTHWPAFLQFVTEIKIVHRKLDLYFEIVPQLVQVLDWLQLVPAALQIPGVRPSFPVTVLSVSGNRAHYAFCTGYPFLSLPGSLFCPVSDYLARCQTQPPRKDVAWRAYLMLSGHKDPLLTNPDGSTWCPQI